MEDPMLLTEHEVEVKSILVNHSVVVDIPKNMRFKFTIRITFTQFGGKYVIYNILAGKSINPWSYGDPSIFRPACAGSIEVEQIRFDSAEGQHAAEQRIIKAIETIAYEDLINGAVRCSDSTTTPLRRVLNWINGEGAGLGAPLTRERIRKLHEVGSEVWSMPNDPPAITDDDEYNPLRARDTDAFGRFRVGMRVVKARPWNPDNPESPHRHGYHRYGGRIHVPIGTEGKILLLHKGHAAIVDFGSVQMEVGTSEIEPNSRWVMVERTTRREDNES